MNELVDIDFGNCDWSIDGNGDLRLATGAEAFRGVVNRWLLTTPATDEPGLTAGEIEGRKRHVDQAARDLEYDAPGGAALMACLPWDPTWGLGIKRYIGRTLTDDALAEIETRARIGLAGLEGVRSVDQVTASAVGDELRLAWAVTTTYGAISDTLRIQ